MKKQILTLAAGFMVITFISCNKEVPQAPGGRLQENENNTSVNSVPSNNTLVNVTTTSKADPLTNGLEGWFEFDKNLKDNTGKLHDASATIRNPLYTTDRKGHANAALKLDSTYFVRIANVVQQTHSSVSVWVKYGNVVPFCPFIRSNDAGIVISQQNFRWTEGVYIPGIGTQAAYSRDTYNGWHHIVATYDGGEIKLYIDASYVVPVTWVGSYGPVYANYIVGSGINEYWRGYVDDLRFYSRTLSAADVQALHDL
ncbi:MAG: LamG domain-containing protein [Ferruginibacter sp.]